MYLISAQAASIFCFSFHQRLGLEIEDKITYFNISMFLSNGYRICVKRKLHVRYRLACLNMHVISVGLNTRVQ